MKALKYNPSMGRVYLAIAAMYAKSANNCGEDNFSKASSLVMLPVSMRLESWTLKVRKPNLFGSQ